MGYTGALALDRPGAGARRLRRDRRPLRRASTRPMAGGPSGTASPGASATDAATGAPRGSSAYAIRSTLDLYNNFTYFLDDPVQRRPVPPDRPPLGAGRRGRATAALDALGRAMRDPLRRPGPPRRHPPRPVPHPGAHGAVARCGRTRCGRTASASSPTARSAWTRLAAATGGVRADWMGGHGAQRQRGEFRHVPGEWIASPKAGLVLGPWWATEFFLNAGSGFHSNDLRGATIRVDPADRLTPASRVPLLVRAKGAEIGVATRAVPGLDSRLAAFVLDLGSEILFLGDAGTTEAEPRRAGASASNGPTAGRRGPGWRSTSTWRRRGRASPNPTRPAATCPARRTWCWPRARAGTRGRLVRRGAAAGLRAAAADRGRQRAVPHHRAGECPRRLPAGERLTLQLDAFNLFNTKASQIDYCYASRLPGEPAAGVEDRHFHPVEPLAVRFTVAAAL